MIGYNNDSIKGVYYGSNKIDKAYYGSTLVYTSGLLPKNYTLYDYVYNSANCYINTEVPSADDVGIYVRYYKSNANGQIMVGARDATSTNSRITICASTQLYWGWNMYCGSPSPVISSSAYMNKWINGGTNYLNSRLCYQTVEETNTSTYWSTSGTLICTNARPIYIFAANWGGAAGINYIGRISSVKISKGTDVVRDYIPCANESGVVGMYDIVEGKFYAPASGTLYGGYN